jgi:hypothetical protein
MILAFDGDVVRKESVRKALRELADYLTYKQPCVECLWLPDTDDKTGLDDYLMAGHTVEELWRLVKPTAPTTRRAETGTGAGGLARRRARRIPAVATHGGHRAGARRRRRRRSQPRRGRSGVATYRRPAVGRKTEILYACSSLLYVVPAATITEAALLSGTSARERAKNATGGLLRQIGDFGILLAKDFTSVLSQNRDTAKQAMAALREVYDGD